MIYGPAPQRTLPIQRWDVTAMLIDRFYRAQDAMRPWAERAKKAVEYYEGKQWAAADLAKLLKEGRPGLTINKIRPLVNLVAGYMLNNRTDIAYQPEFDTTGTDEIAGALTHLSKFTSEISDLPWIDAEVFLDGVLGGRGFYHGEFTFMDNDLGDLKWKAGDPFATYLDPDADEYDLNSGAFVMDRRWLSIDEVGYFYGQRAQELLQPMVSGSSFVGLPSAFFERADEATPWRRFGGESESEMGMWENRYGNMLLDFVDTARKNVQVLCIEHYIPVWRKHFVDLETGDKQAIPDHYTAAQIESLLNYCRTNGEAIIVANRMDRRVRWTHLAGDIMVYDDWSPFETFNKIPYFPYFRRGQTQGMVEHLTDSQDEINKRRSSRLNIINRAASSGWIYPKGSLDAQQKRNLELYGSTPGVHIEYDTKNGKLANAQPKQIEPTTNPVAHQQLEREAEGDLKDIAGINESALGNIDTVQSGRAIEAKQRQSIVGLEGFMANYSRTKKLQGRKQLEIYQQHYTEKRVIRVTGNGNTPEDVQINVRTAEGIINNITVGKYGIITNENPLSRTFLEAQFEEIMRMKEMNLPIPDDFIIDASSLSKKQALKAAIAAEREAQAQQAMIAAGIVPPGGTGQVKTPASGPTKGGKGLSGEHTNSQEPGAPTPPGGNVVPMKPAAGGAQ